MAFVQCNNKKKYVKPEEWKERKNRKYFQDSSRKLLRIEYPGIVENVNRMLQTLGGVPNIGLTVGNPNRRLELRFRPDDVFCKPCFGDKELSPGILVKVKMKQAKSGKEPPTYSYSLVGVCGTNIKFNRLCDFQYLPLLAVGEPETKESHLTNIYEKIVPPELPSIDMLNDPTTMDMPLFLPPAIFAKNNSSQNQFQLKRHKYYEGIAPEIAERMKRNYDKPQRALTNVFDRDRKERRVASIFINFKSPTVPTEARPEALSLMRERNLDQHYEKLKKLFEERAMWPKTALSSVLSIRIDKLKIILPCVAYYFQTGPWRTQWCRFGYDPRKDPNARMYQTFDFRIRASEGLKLKVQAKRNYSTGLMHYKAGRTTSSKYSLSQSFTEKKTQKELPDEKAWTLRPGVLPPYRQIFYQYRDIFLPEVQEMLARLPEVTRTTVCDPKNGWLPRGFMDHCRDTVTKHVQGLVQQELFEDKKKLEAPGAPEASEKEPELSPDAMITLVDEEVDSEVITIDPDEITEEAKGTGEKRESVESDEAGASSEEDIDMEAVEEINKLIWNSSDAQAAKSSDGAKASLPPELVQMYHTLILSDGESDCDDTPGPSIDEETERDANFLVS